MIEHHLPKKYYYDIICMYWFETDGVKIYEQSTIHISV